MYDIDNTDLSQGIGNILLPWEEVKLEPPGIYNRVTK